MTERQKVVFPYGGRVDAAAVVGFLSAGGGTDAIALALDLGQDRDVEESRDRALGAGAVRAHVLDCRAEVAAAFLSAIRGGAVDDAPAFDAEIDAIAARALLDVARAEQADAIASPGPGLTAALLAEDPVVRIVDLPAMPAVPAPSRHLLHRPVRSIGAAPVHGARLAIAFEQGVPVALNDVSLPLTDLFESLSLIAGQHGVGATPDGNLPAALVLASAYEVLDASGDGVVHVDLLQGQHTIVPRETRHAELVNHA